jgi:hypothetical protein
MGDAKAQISFNTKEWIDMRRGFGFIGLLVTVILFVIVGAIAYNVGWSDGVNTHLPAVTQTGDGTTVPAYYYGQHYWGGPGFGFFGILWFLLIVFGLFWLFRLAFFGRRMWGGGGWGGGWGYGHKGGYGPGIPPGIDERMQEWHKKAHGEQGSSGTTPPPPDTRTV